MSNGLFTGEVGETLVSGKGVVTKLLAQYPFEGSIAVGDSANDIDMLTHVHHPICINPDKELKAHATSHNWPTCLEKDAEALFQKLLSNSK